MTNLLQDVQKLAVTKAMPQLKTGLTVKIYQKVKEGEKERIQTFEGLIIKMNSGFGADKTFTVRRIVDGIGVEKTFAVYSTTIEKIEVKRISKIRRAKLYYMRDRSGKSARLKDRFISQKELDAEMEASIAELAASRPEEAAAEPTQTEENIEEIAEQMEEEMKQEEMEGPKAEETVEEAQEPEVVEEPEEKKEEKSE